MNIYFFTDENLFKGNYIADISKYGNIIYCKKDNEYNCDLLAKDDKEKILIYDPDFAGWEFPNDVLNKIKNIKAIFLGTTDMSYLDVKLCEQKNIDVINIPRYAHESVAEYLVMYMFLLSKKIPLQIKNDNKQEFSNEYLQIELINRKVGIVGLGNIGQRVAEMCSGIGMDIYYWNRTKKNNNYKYLELPNLFKECDIIFICLSINDETKKLITDSMLNSMKKECILISGTGKQLFNSNLVEEKVANKELFGYAIEEADKPLNSYNGNIMVTSEYGWFTKEASELRIKKWTERIIKYLNQ